MFTEAFLPLLNNNFCFFFVNIVLDLYEGVGGLVQPADETVVGDGEVKGEA